MWRRPGCFRIEIKWPGIKAAAHWLPLNAQPLSGNKSESAAAACKLWIPPDRHGPDGGGIVGWWDGGTVDGGVVDSGGMGGGCGSTSIQVELLARRLSLCLA